MELQRCERRHGVGHRPRDLQRRRDHERLLDDHRPSGGISASIGVTCQSPQLKYIKITPSKECEIPAGGKIQLTATGTLASGATKNVTATATWTSSNPSVATVSAGLVSCKTPHSYYDGHAIISAFVGSVSGSTYVTCEGLGR